MIGRVLVVGDIMRDVVVRPAGALRRGTDQRADIVILPGGAGANQAVLLARAGVPVRLAACVGAEDRAAECDALRREGVEPALACRTDLPTGTLVALVDQDGERSFLTARGANDGFRRADRPDGLMDGVAHLHLSGYALVGEQTRETALGLLAEARRDGLTISVDPGSSAFMRDLGPAHVLGWLAGADLCILNADEAAVLAASDDPETQLARLGGHFGLTVLKRGSAPALARLRHRETCAAMPPVTRAVDTTGAGDAFLARFLADWLASKPVDACLEAAVRAGAAAVTHAGARGPDPRQTKAGAVH